jgi:4-carboxymuconolactone decarboxylase
VSRLGQTVRFQEILRKLAMIDEGFVEHQAGFGLDPAGPSGSGSQDRGAAAGRAAWPPGPLGVPGMEYRAGAGGGRGEEEIANVLLAIAPVTGLGRVVAAAPDVATALGYDVTASLVEPDGH